MQKLLAKPYKEIIRSPEAKKIKRLKFLYSDEIYQKILDKIDTDLYKGKVSILDYYARISPLSYYLNERLKPKNHVVYPEGKSYQKFWQQQGEIWTNLHIAESPIPNTFMANIMKKPLSKKWLTPEMQPEINDNYGVGATPVNPSLLVVADFSSMATASCLRTALYYNEVATSVFSYGGVKFLAWTTPGELLKYYAPPGSVYRKTNFLMTNYFTEIKLLACSKELTSKAQKVLTKVLEKDRPVELPDDYCLVEFQSNHNKFKISYPDELHTCVHKLFCAPGCKLGEKLHVLGPGAQEYLTDRLSKDMLDKKINCLSLEEFILLSEEFWAWPFKPDIRLELFNSPDIFEVDD